MRNLFRLARLCLAEFLRLSGALHLIAKQKLKDRVCVLMYHRIISDENQPFTDSSPGIIVSASAFEMQMHTVRRWMNPISLDEFAGFVLNGKSLPPRSCLVTIDDGWIDNYDTAFAILRKYEIPATIFLPTDYISSSRMFWQEELLMRLTWLLESGSREQIDKLREIIALDDPLRIPSIEDIRSYVLRVKVMDEMAIERLVSNLRAELRDFEKDEHYNKYMTWEQTAKMSLQGVVFASHACSHRRLTRLNDKDCRDELATSRQIIEAQLSNNVFAIAYPNGDHDERIIGIARDVGYTIGFSTLSGLCERETDPLVVPRLNVHGHNGNTEALFLSTCLNLF